MDVFPKGLPIPLVEGRINAPPEITSLHSEILNLWIIEFYRVVSGLI
jgi:hypothetical protein